jgi:predicted ATPase
MSTSAIGALERGSRRAPYRDTVALLATALGLAAHEHAELEAVASQARGRQPRIDAEPQTRHNLPIRLTSFLGRDAEIAEIEALLRTCRLVTITGSGGVGKTRTATEVAKRLLGEQQEEAWFIDLSTIDDGALVAGTIAAVLDVALAPDADSSRSIAAKLKARKLLLILDNCEHVIDEAAVVVAAILRTCPGITILATSRERFAIEGERAYRLPSLLVPTRNPATTAEACSYASFQLFLERATAFEPTLTFDAERLRTSAEVCRRLEGIPLALELAASRLSTLGLAGLNKGLREHFVLTNIARDVPQRQRTMLATIAWSHDLLSERERVLLRRLSIFRGGITLEAAEAVCADAQLPARSIPDVMSLLVDKSLLSIRISEEHGRYYMLESVRAFALTKLSEASETEPIARANLCWLATIADRGHDLYSNMSSDRWHGEFGAELDNIRSALDWAVNHGTDDDALLGARIVGGLRGLWTATDRHGECHRWTAEFIDRVDESRYPVIASRLLTAHIQVSRGAAVFDAAERAVPVFEGVGDALSLISLHAHVAWFYSRASRFAEAEQSVERAFALADTEGIQRSRRYVDLLEIRAAVRARARRTDEARKDLSDAAQLRSVVGGGDARNLNLSWSAYIEFVDGNVERSAELYEACVNHYRMHSGNPAVILHQLAGVRLALGDLDRAESAVREALELAGFESHIVWAAIWHLAAVAALRGHPGPAGRLFGFALATSDLSKPLEDPIERSSYDILMASLHEQLPAAAIAALQADGAQLDLDGALEEAFKLCANLCRPSVEQR